MKKLSILIVLLFIGFSCSKVPMTGRRQMKLIPNSQLLDMSFSNYKGFLDTNLIITRGEEYQMVMNSGNKIRNAVVNYMNKSKKYRKRIRGYEWEFRLVESNVANAWCMPGGKVCFYTGIMPICIDEVGVAVVMGHEIAHAIANHGNERMSQGLAAQMGGVALGVAMSQQPETTRKVFMGAYGLGSQVGMMLPFSRLHESEADKMGLMFMAMAGYDPREAIKFWERMEKMSKGAPPEFISTHPSHQTRIDNIKKWLPEAMGYYNKAKK